MAAAVFLWKNRGRFMWLVWIFDRSDLSAGLPAGQIKSGIG